MWSDGVGVFRDIDNEGSRGRSDVVVKLLRAMDTSKFGVEQDVKSFNAAISACENGERP